MKSLWFIFLFVVVISFTSAGCSRSGNDVQIPEYPGAVADQEHKAEVAGVSLAMVRRVFTSDRYEDVVSFYRVNLAGYEPKEMSYDQQGMRQTAFTIKKGKITVVVQDFEEDNAVAIVYMGAGL